MKKKILIVTQNFYPVIGSAGNRMKNIYQLLNEEENIKADVLTTDPAYPNQNLYKDKEFWDDPLLNSQNESIFRVPIRSKKFTNKILSRLFFYLEIMYRFLLSLWKLRKKDYDYIMVSTPPIFIVFSVVVSRIFMKSKIILEVRDLWPDSLLGVKTFDNKVIVRVFRHLEKKMYSKADFIVINSKGFAKHIKSKLPNDKLKPIIYLPNGPRENEMLRGKELNESFRVVYTGNLGLAQDVDHLKVMASSLYHYGIRFDVIGYGIKTEEFYEYVKLNDLDNVQIHKPTTRKKSLELIRNCDVAVAFLNDEEVFSTVLPGKIIDYMTCKTPVIAGVKGTAAELIEKNNAGFVFEQENTDGMVNKIVELSNNPNELKVLGDNGVKTVKQNFLWEKNIKMLTEIIT